MGRHSKSGPNNTNSSGDYDAKHAGGWDGSDWAEYSNATAETTQIPKVDDKKKGK